METLKYTCVPSSLPCIAWLVSSTSKEVVIGKSACGHFLTVVMETMKYLCAQSFISMCTIVGKFEKYFKENCLNVFVVGCCHGNHFCVMGVT